MGSITLLILVLAFCAVCIQTLPSNEENNAEIDSEGSFLYQDSANILQHVEGHMSNDFNSELDEAFFEGNPIEGAAKGGGGGRKGAGGGAGGGQNSRKGGGGKGGGTKGNRDKDKKTPPSGGKGKG